MDTFIDSSDTQPARPAPRVRLIQVGEALQQRVRGHLKESARVTMAAVEQCEADIMAAAHIIAGAMRAGGKLLLCGNGGSAADCQHLATEFVSRLTKDFARPALAAMALTTDTSFLTAFANDCGFGGIFQRQVEALGRPGDVLLGVSTSGNSNNVVLAVEAATARGMQTITLCGEGGKLAAMSTQNIAVPSSYTPHIQETHLAIEHVICDVVERLLFGQSFGEPGSRIPESPGICRTVPMTQPANDSEETES